MPSPIAHASLILVVRAFAERHQKLRRALGGRPGFFYIGAVALLWAPDIDFVIRALYDRPGLEHGGVTHSLVLTALFGVVFAAACRVRYGPRLPAASVLAVGVGCAWTHVLMDATTWGSSGVMLLWPFSGERYTAVPLFFGARHSQPTAWSLHLITLASELLFVAVLWYLLRRSWRRHPLSGVKDTPETQRSAGG
jgi:membrane-bound metal-dependent hydrolase YbcI (DUF457 family)